MRQIPTSSEWCGGGYCPCFRWVDSFCNLYEQRVGKERFPVCLRDKPQVLTEGEREDLYRKGRSAE